MKKKTIKYIRNLYRLKKELNYNAIKDIRNLLRLGNETKTIKDGDTKNLFEHEEEEEEN